MFLARAGIVGIDSAIVFAGPLLVTELSVSCRTRFWRVLRTINATILSLQFGIIDERSCSPMRSQANNLCKVYRKALHIGIIHE